ncbi:MAG: hypothetical protein LKF32_06910 [Mageeibacillus sp.]|jgi:hypothetical protein|nr:hypothetical protein [Mageeibacillus sp.]MCI1264408.1 hypothetical protein [Saccharofermentans sp.]MCI1769525.1 hypothetical protein [Mageeibacillus sp.]MCI2044387.1 hypothetical protein [Mageeibacillus sp.]
MEELIFLQLHRKNGFYLIETQLNLISRFSEPNFSPLVKRFLDSINFEDANDVETELVLSEIASGEIFKTDRIALDPHFGCKIAGVRYANWIRDTLNCSGHLLVAKKNGALSGFVSVALKDDYADAILGGALSSNRIPSIGVMCSYAGVTFARETGAKYVITSVSSNNIPAMKINLAAGYEIKDSLYVLVRHIS